MIYRERTSNTAQLIGIDYSPMMDVDLTADRQDTINVYFSEPFCDQNKRLKIEYTIYECE